MVFGHAAIGSLLHQTRLPRAGLAFCLIAAFGPDWFDKPLKLLFRLSGHGIAHSLIGSAAILGLFWWVCRRWRLPDSWPFWAAVLWGLHLACDLPGATVLCWPLFGQFPTLAESTAALAWKFYTVRPLSALALTDLALTALALAARLGCWPHPIRSTANPG